MFENVRSIIVYNSELNYMMLNVNLLSGVVLFVIGFNFLNSYSQKVFEYL